MFRKITTLASMLFLTACGSSGGDGVEIPTAISDRVASVGLVGTFSNGGTPTDGSDDRRNWTASETQDTFSLRTVGTRSLVMTINGVNHVFIPSDFVDGVWTNSENVSMRAVDDYNIDTIYQILDGTHAFAHGTYLFYSTNRSDLNSGANSFNLDHTDGFATVGTRTSALVVQQQTAIATYKGLINFNIYPNRGIASGPSPARYYYGDITMNVDFDSNRVSGEAVLGLDIDSQFSVAGVATFASTDISGNGFGGIFTLDNALRADMGITGNYTGNYGGNFFGPNVESVVGVMRLNGITADGSAIGFGGFGADKQ